MYNRHSHMLRTKKLLSDTIQLLCKLINMNLLYTYANVMQQIDNSNMWHFHNNICNKHCIWIWFWKISICFNTDVNTFTKLHKQQIHLSLPKIWINMTYISFLKYNSSSVVEQNRAEPKFILELIDESSKKIHNANNSTFIA
jgi:hypothetical protein